MIKRKVKRKLVAKQNTARTDQVYFAKSRQNWKPKYKKIKKCQALVVVKNKKTLAHKHNLVVKKLKSNYKKNIKTGK